MQTIKWRFLLLAIFAGILIVATGISLGQGSLAGTLISTGLLIAVFGFGFSMKKKMIKNGEL